MLVTHILGWGTLASQLGVAGYVAKYLYRTGRYPWSWYRPLIVPKLATGDFPLSTGSDYVGFH